MANETLLVITGAGVMPYSARGLVQTLQPIEADGDVRRTVNGDLVDVGPGAAFQKLQSVITGNDQISPAVNGIWKGAAVTVDCIAELNYLTSGGSPAHTIVPGSEIIDGDYTRYRPRLNMMVVEAWNLSANEYAAQVSWSLTLAEV